MNTYTQAKLVQRSPGIGKPRREQEASYLALPRLRLGEYTHSQLALIFNLNELLSTRLRVADVQLEAS